MVVVALGALLFALSVGLLVRALLRRQVALVGEAEVGRRLHRGYRVRALTALGLAVGTGIGTIAGSSVGFRDAGGIAGFALSGILGVAYGVRHDRAARRAASDHGSP